MIARDQSKMRIHQACNINFKIYELLETLAINKEHMKYQIITNKGILKTTISNKDALEAFEQICTIDDIEKLGIKIDDFDRKFGIVCWIATGNSCEPIEVAGSFFKTLV